MRQRGFTTLIFQRERAHDVIDEIYPLLRKHYDEVSANKDIKLDPNWEGYMKLEDADMLRLFTVRTNEHVLIGYNCYFLNFTLHSSLSLQAVQDVLYIDKEQRGFGRSFIDWCAHELKKDNVQVMYSHIQATHNFGPMLESIGYKLTNLVYEKRLDI